MTHQPYYETMYILRPDIPEEEVETHLKKYSEVLVAAGGEILDNQMRGKRRLAYTINKHKEGIYVQLSHNGDGQQVAVLEKAMRLSEDVIRYLTVKQNGPLPTPRVAANSENSTQEKDKDKDKPKDQDQEKEKEKEKEKPKEKTETETEPTPETKDKNEDNS